MTDFPADIAGLSQALTSQRKYTLDLYADLPQTYWEPAKFPFLQTINPPLWELAHIAWFAEFFCLRWRPDDCKGQRTPSCMANSDALFDSAAVAHSSRWVNVYPPREACLDFMKRSLELVLAALDSSIETERYMFQLAVAHEDMHGEALAMTLRTIGLPLRTVPSHPNPVKVGVSAKDIFFGGGEIALGESGRAFRFDNEMPAQVTTVGPFAISQRVVTSGEFAEFEHSAAYDDDRLWSMEGAIWRRSANKSEMATDVNLPAMHVNLFQAEAWCRWAGRRLPSEAEWEYAAVQSAAFAESTGQVWEWTASPFVGYLGFKAGPYRDYSAPWFGSHQVLRGGSFATHLRLKYPQYRNFYAPGRRDMFCGFRTCAAAF
jgi:gamma-glutamyl hercynylcysteine S-oxide synthase